MATGTCPLGCLCIGVERRAPISKGFFLISSNDYWKLTRIGFSHAETTENEEDSEESEGIFERLKKKFCGESESERDEETKEKRKSTG